jgi:aldehyde:ferredoxin oxidoreductase
MYGYHGRVLHVDLSDGRSWSEPLSPETLRQFVGGIGLGTYLLYRECPPGADPLGPDNPLIFVTSPFVDTAITTSAKYAVLAKSPLTGFIGDSLSGSHLAIALKRTGFDALVVHGRCPTWSTLLVEDGSIQIKDAEHLLGLGTWETEAALRAEGGGGRVAAIGPAGERLVRFATISNDGRHAGRTGTGAVMGAKRLKAIVLRDGHAATSIADPRRLKHANAALIERSLGPDTAKYRQLGTPANLLAFDRLGVLPTRNFQQGTFAHAEQLSGEALHGTHLAKVSACASCTIGCVHLYRTLDQVDEAMARVEYETLFALGPLLGVGDPNDVIRAAQACDHLGMDSISAGGTLAWAMECAERGLLDTGATDLRFGSAEGIIGALQAIAARNGVGNLLAEGSRLAARQLGKGSEAWAMHVKGLELPGYEPRGLKTLALGFAVTPRGACHNRSSAYEMDFSGLVDRFEAERERGQMAAEAEDLACVLDSLVLCKFVRKCFDDLYEEAAALYRLVTDLPMTGTGLRRVGERISNLKKLFNIREGWTRADDTLPARCLEEPLPDGPGAGQRLSREDLDLMIAGYYAARGWTEDGLVPDQKIADLDLSTLVRAV